MHGELPQELSVTALEALGTGTGHAEGKKFILNHSFPLDDEKVYFGRVCHLGMSLLYLHFLMVDNGSKKGWLKNVSADRREMLQRLSFLFYELLLFNINSLPKQYCKHSPKSILSF